MHNKKPPEKPKPPLLRVIAEGDGKFCRYCGSGLVISWFGKVKGCRQPECEYYYKGVK